MLGRRFRRLWDRTPGPWAQGVLDAWLGRRSDQVLFGPLNGQLRRQEMVSELLREIPVSLVVETGTCWGGTTDFLARATSVRVLSVELDPRRQGFSSVRLRGHENVTLLRGDSREALRGIAANPTLQGGTPFFYLDAHWGKDLPLGGELEIVFSSWSRALVLVDDFQVEDDPGYGFDDYGPGKALTWDYLRDLVERFQLEVFYPAAPSSRETGALRGCLLLTLGEGLGARVEDLDSLRRVPGRSSFSP